MSENIITKNASNERKRNSQRLYRYALQLAQRLDLQLQSANEWQEFFDTETLLLRQKLKDTCESLLLTCNSEISRKVEDLLWRKGFYDLIQKLRQDKKLLQSNAQLFALYNAHLSAAHAFYHRLLFQVKEKFDLPMISLLDWLGNTDSLKGSYKEKNNEDISPDSLEWAVKSCQRCLVFLGDIARYKMDLGFVSALEQAERYYHQAVWVNPDNGMPHNQLGTLKQQGNFHDSEVAYHYLRCLVSAVSFHGAEDNLKRTFERNKCQENADGHEISLIQQFLVEFLALHENFRYERLQPVEFSRICQSVIEKFAETLQSPLWKEISSNLSHHKGDYENEMMKFNDFDKRISDGLMMKLFVICIITVSDLLNKNSEIVSAAVAFTFTLLSKLLDFISKSLSESPLSMTVRLNESENEARSCDLSNDVDWQQNGNSEDHLKCKKRKVRLMQRHRRRRRRRGSASSENEESEHDDDHDPGDYDDDYGDDRDDSSSDLSEGELLNQFLSSDDNGEESDVGSTDDGLPCPIKFVAKDKKEKFAKSGREADRRKLRNLCEVGKALSSQLLTTEDILPRTDSRNKLWSNESNLKSSLVDVSLETSLVCFTEICYLQTFKIMTDWLRYAGDNIGIFRRDLSCVWQKVAKALNELPSHQLLLIILQSVKRRNSAAELLAPVTVSIPQQKVLPEDKSLIGLPFLTSLHKSLDYDWDSKTSHAAILQFIIRVQALKSFGSFLSEKVALFRWDEVNGRFDYGKEVKENRPSDVPQQLERDAVGKNQQENAKSQDGLMKALAKQKLMHEVSELQDKMNLTNIHQGSGEMPPYLILDSQALCRHLSFIRSLAKSREFIMIVPIQIVQALDELKRYNTGAREAIKFLEAEFRQSSKWLRSQKDDESSDYDFNPNGKRKKNIAVEEWRFHQVVKCSLFFAKKIGKPNMVSILVSYNQTSGSIGTRSTADAREACQKNDIVVESVVDFYQRWVSKKKVGGSS